MHAYDKGPERPDLRRTARGGRRRRQRGDGRRAHGPAAGRRGDDRTTAVRKRSSRRASRRSTTPVSRRASASRMLDQPHRGPRRREARAAVTGLYGAAGDGVRRTRRKRPPVAAGGEGGLGVRDRLRRGHHGAGHLRPTRCWRRRPKVSKPTAGAASRLTSTKPPPARASSPEATP